jgi:hypothetical protein
MCFLSDIEFVKTKKPPAVETEGDVGWVGG